MDFVKREDGNIIDEENYRIYLDNLQKSNQLDITEYQHTPISMEQLHQAMQSSLNPTLHNFQLPISPRQMSTLMMKTNHISRSINFNDLPVHLPKNLTMDMELISLHNDLPQNLRHDDGVTQSLARNIDMSIARSELELQNSLAHVQNLHEQELTRNLNAEMGNFHRENHDLGNEMDLSHLRQQSVDSDLIINQDEVKKDLSLQIESHLLEQHITQRIEQNVGLRLDQVVDRIESLPHRIDSTLAQRLDQSLAQRLDQSLAQRLDQSLAQRLDQNSVGRLDQNLAHRIDQTLAQRLDQNLAQRLDQTLAQRLDHRLFSTNVLHDAKQQLDQNQHLFNVQCQIKSEQEDDGYFYENINQINGTGINGEIHEQADHSQPSLHHDQIFSLYSNQIPVQTLNSMDLYSRQQTYVQNYISEISHENPQNLVVHRQFDNHSPYSENIKKSRQDDDASKKESKNEDPKENLKPNDQNKMYYCSNDYVLSEKNHNDSSPHSKITDEISMNIKGEYTCFKCQEVLTSKRLLKQHAKTCDHGENSEILEEKMGKFSCSQCAYRCQSPAILKIHERTHTGEKPYACTLCDYKSGQKNNVAKHLLVHMKQKPFSCQYCDYRCAQKNNLVVHERTHTGYKPFACPFCDYRTVQKPNLVKHMYLHTDQKPFSCDICNYRCVQKTNLTKHKQRHINEKDGDKIDAKNPIKPYKPRQKSVKCPHCSYRCVQKSSLEKHLQFKHSENGELSLAKNDEYISEDKLTDECVQNLSVKKCDYDSVDKIYEPMVQS